GECAKHSACRSEIELGHRQLCPTGNCRSYLPRLEMRTPPAPRPASQGLLESFSYRSSHTPQQTKLRLPGLAAILYMRGTHCASHQINKYKSKSGARPAPNFDAHVRITWRDYNFGTRGQISGSKSPTSIAEKCRP